MRAFWKGYLRLSLVNCAVELTPATTDSEKVRFHTLNRKTGNRILSRFVDSAKRKPVRDQDEVRGYQVSDEKYIILEEDELDSVALESTRTINIDKFIPRDSVGWIWYDKPHYLTPSDKIGEEAFAVIREAMAQSDVFGLARLVMYRRERAVLLEPRDRGIILWTLHFGDEVRDQQDYISDISKFDGDKKLLAMVRSLIETKTIKWNADILQDPVQKNLKSMIAAKKRKKKITKHAAQCTTQEEGGKVINIMDALRESLAKGKTKS